MKPKSSAVVPYAGLATTALTLFGIYLLNIYVDDFNIMGWYGDYIIPVGALIVGVAASSGYGIASWYTGVKITKRILWFVLFLQVVAYFAAQYIEFHNLHLTYNDGTPVSFFEYYDHVARSFAWKQHDGKPGDPLGIWGYFFRALEVIGFCGGSLIVPLALLNYPYCQDCQLYMRRKQLVSLPAAVPVKRIKKSDATGQAAFNRADEEALALGNTLLSKFRQLATDGKGTEFTTLLREWATQKKATAKLPRRIFMQLVCCRRCHNGWLEANAKAGQGNNIKTTALGNTPVTPDFVRAIRPDV